MTDDWQNLPEIESIGEPPDEPVPFPDGERPPLVAEKDKTEYTHCAFFDGDDCFNNPCTDCDINTIPFHERRICG